MRRDIDYDLRAIYDTSTHSYDLPLPQFVLLVPNLKRIKKIINSTPRILIRILFYKIKYLLLKLEGDMGAYLHFHLSFYPGVLLQTHQIV